MRVVCVRPVLGRFPWGHKGEAGEGHVGEGSKCLIARGSNKFRGALEHWGVEGAQPQRSLLEKGRDVVHDQ